MRGSHRRYLGRIVDDLMVAMQRGGRRHYIPRVFGLECPDCEDVPRRPITVPCGHTRCTDCYRKGPCKACGTAAGTDPSDVQRSNDVLVVALLEKLFKPQLKAAEDADNVNQLLSIGENDAALQLCSQSLIAAPTNHRLRGMRACAMIHLKQFDLAKEDIDVILNEKPTSPEGYFLRGEIMFAKHCYRKAIANYLVALVLGKRPQSIRHKMIQTLSLVCEVKRRRRWPQNIIKFLKWHLASIDTTSSDSSSYKRQEIGRLMKRLMQDASRILVELEATKKNKEVEDTQMRSKCWPSEAIAAELECVLCCRVFDRPVTTPCGHTYCRSCLERCLDYGRACPLCIAPLDGFFADGGPNDSVFATTVLSSLPLDVRKGPDERADRLLPVFVCTTAFPSVSCPLFVFEPRYRLMVRRCLESGSRRFGIAACMEASADGSPRYADFGTVLEIRDCIRMADGRSILSTMGVSRFRVLARGEMDGYDVARVEAVIDRTSSCDEVKRLRVEVRRKAHLWLQGMDSSSRSEIEQTFGEMPPEENEKKNTKDGPAWSWWLLAVLPLATKLKVMILATEELVKRLRAIDRTLDFLYFVSGKGTWHTTTPAFPLRDCFAMNRGGITWPQRRNNAGDRMDEHRTAM